MRNVYISRITVLTAVMSLSVASAYARDVDVMVEHCSAKGQTERAVTSTSHVKEIRSKLQKGSDLRILKKLAPEKFRDSAAPDDEPADGFKVLFAVEDEANDGYTWYPWKVYVTHPDGEYGRDYYNYAYKPEEEMEAEGYAWGCYVPEGTYDVILGTSRSSDTGSYVSAYVVKEGVKISGDTTITFRQSEAKNLLTAKFYFEDGEEMPQLSEDNWDKYSYGYSRCVNHKGGSYAFNMYNVGGVQDSILVNNLSDNWTYAINQVAVTPKGGYVNKLVIPGPFTSDMNFANNPEDYVKTSAEFNPLDSTDMSLNAYGVNSFMTWKGADWNCSAGVTMTYPGDYSGKVDMYLNTGRSDMSAYTGYDVFVSPVIGQNVYTYYEDWGDGDIYEYKELVYATGASMLPDTDGEYLYINGGMDWGYSLGQYPDETFFLPVISPFAYEAKEMTYFRFAPVLWLNYLRCFYNEYWGVDILNAYCSSSYPTFESWSLPTSESVTNNGATFMEGDLWNWSLEGNYVPGPVKIDYSAVWSTKNNDAFCTTSTFSFDTAKEFYNPPMVSQYQVRNNDNAISSVVNADGKIMFAVKDADYDVKDVRAKVKANGSDEWTDLECFNIADYDDLSSYGLYYEVHLTALQSESPAIYDLRFECEDAEGNTSEAVIEGAFTLDSAVGVSSMASDFTPVRVEGKRIIAPEKADIFNLNGVRVSGNNLTSGIYFVSVNNHTYKVMVK